MTYSAFFAGLSGLKSHSYALSVIGDNLANINTLGYKGSVTSFQDPLTQNMSSSGGSGNPRQIGLGVTIGTISPIFSQGSLQTTNQATDVAIQGSGFFILRNHDSYAFSRAGNFGFDADGVLINSSGLPVQGYSEVNADGEIDTTSSIGNIVIDSNCTSPPNATSLVSTSVNIDAEEEIGSTYNTTFTLYDSLGASHLATITWIKTAAGSYNYDITLEGDEVQGGLPDTPYSIKTGTIVFDSSGQLDPLIGVDGAPPADVLVGPTPAFTNGAAAQNFTWDIVKDDGTGTLTGYASPSTTSSTSQDGFGPGRLQALSINNDGLIEGSFSNGEVMPLGLIALANFNNPNGLYRLGSNLFRSSIASGEALVGTANSGGRGSIAGNTLELSNVDIAGEFTNLIINQRGYQANSRIISTTDEVIQEAINLKR